MASLEDQCRSEHAGIGQCTKAFVGPPGRPHVAEVISTILVMNANVTPIRWQESALCNQLPYLASSIVVSPCTVLVLLVPPCHHSFQASPSLLARPPGRCQSLPSWLGLNFSIDADLPHLRIPGWSKFELGEASEGLEWSG